MARVGGVLVLVALVGCAGEVCTSAGREALVGGEVVEDDFLPVGRLVYPDSEGDIDGSCTVTLVSPTHVVAAAHCVTTRDGATASDLPGYVLFGNSTNDREELIRVVSSVTHPDWPGDVPVPDVAYLVLEEPSTMPPAVLSSVLPLVGDELDYLGFGLTEPNGEIGVKRRVRMPVTQIDEAGWFGSASRTDNRGVCTGDSGGPAFATARDEGRLVLVGINTRGSCGLHHAEDGLGGTISWRVDRQLDFFEATGAEVVDSESSDPIEPTEPPPSEPEPSPTPSNPAPADSSC